MHVEGGVWWKLCLRDEVRHTCSRVSREGRRTGPSETLLTSVSATLPWSAELRGKHMSQCHTPCTTAYTIILSPREQARATHCDIYIFHQQKRRQQQWWCPRGCQSKKWTRGWLAWESWADRLLQTIRGRATFRDRDPNRESRSLTGAWPARPGAPDQTAQQVVLIVETGKSSREIALDKQRGSYHVGRCMLIAP